MTMFTNCYCFNPPHYGVVQMAKTLEQAILAKLENMPAEVSISFVSISGLRSCVFELLFV